MTTTFLPVANNQRKKMSSEILSPVLPVPGSKDAHFKSACILVHLIDTSLESGRVQFRTKAGELLTTLDEVVRAIIADELLEPEL